MIYNTSLTLLKPVLSGSTVIIWYFFCNRVPLNHRTNLLIQGQYMDGLRFPLIIHNPSEPNKYDEELTVTVSGNKRNLA